MNKWNGKEHMAPFDKTTGELLNYVYQSDDKYDWRDVTKPFRAGLEYSGYGRGRSSILFEFTNVDNGKKYQMFVSDMNDLLKAGKFTDVIWSDWVIVKKGSNYGIKLV